VIHETTTPLMAPGLTGDVVTPKTDQRPRRYFDKTAIAPAAAPEPTSVETAREENPVPEPATSDPAVDCTDPAAPTPERIGEVLRNTTAAVRRDGATPQQDKALRTVADYAEENYGLPEPAQDLRDALDQAKPLLADDGSVRPSPSVDRHLCDADVRTRDADLSKTAGLASIAALTAQARAGFPRIVIEKITLDDGIPGMFRGLGNGLWRFGYDPAQWSRAQAEIAINIYIAGSGAYIEYTPQVYRALRGLDGFRTAVTDPASIALWDEIEQQVIASDDPAATVARYCELISTAPAAPATAPPAEPPEGQNARQADCTAVANRWTITTENGVKVTGHLPWWDGSDPSATGIKPDLLQLHLADLTHRTDFPGQPMLVDTPFGRDGHRERYEADIFRTQITCRPYCEDPAGRVPTVSIEVIDDCFVENLDPDGVADLAAKLRAQAAVLDEVRVQLIAARADWAANGQADA
jgi:hypothetical protein